MRTFNEWISFKENSEFISKSGRFPPIISKKGAEAASGDRTKLRAQAAAIEKQKDAISGILSNYQSKSDKPLVLPPDAAKELMDRLNKIVEETETMLDALKKTLLEIAKMQRRGILMPHKPEGRRTWGQTLKHIFWDTPKSFLLGLAKTAIWISELTTKHLEWFLTCTKVNLKSSISNPLGLEIKKDMPCQDASQYLKSLRHGLSAKLAIPLGAFGIVMPAIIDQIAIPKGAELSDLLGLTSNAAQALEHPSIHYGILGTMTLWKIIGTINHKIVDFIKSKKRKGERVNPRLLEITETLESLTPEYFHRKELTYDAPGGPKTRDTWWGNINKGVDKYIGNPISKLIRRESVDPFHEADLIIERLKTKQKSLLIESFRG